MNIPFNIPYKALHEIEYITQALESGRLSGNNHMGQKAIDMIAKKIGHDNIFLVPSGTSALEMGVWLCDLEPGDEVIMPSYTFSSTANAVVLARAKPVFCEINPVTMNVDVDHIKSLITSKTKLLLPIDYAGIPCDIEEICDVAKKNNLLTMFDAAQSFGSYYKGKACGSFGDLAAFSFHETKNISCGEGGALVVNNPDWIERAHFLQEKGTDRRLVLHGLKSKYHWVDIGSSYLLSDILAAVLLAQLEAEDEITTKRREIVEKYIHTLKPYKEKGLLQYSPYNETMNVNCHAFWVIFQDKKICERFIGLLKEKSVYAYIGYVPLHSSPMGKKFGYHANDLPITEDVASRIVRLPLYPGLIRNLDYCLECITEALRF
jgi:dTDP-4-amino-4,6-dideoxygalactose transaminase